MSEYQPRSGCVVVIIATLLWLAVVGGVTVASWIVGALA